MNIPVYVLIAKYDLAIKIYAVIFTFWYEYLSNDFNRTSENYGLRMRRGCLERFPVTDFKGNR